MVHALSSVRRAFLRGMLLIAPLVPASLRAQACTDTVCPTERRALPDSCPSHTGFQYGASATLVSNYIWRGLYVGGLSLQADVTAGYGGFFVNMWWNIGASDWTFRQFNPEVDIAVGFSRRGLSVCYLHMYYFDRYADGTRSRFFDMGNHAPGGGGTTGEWRVSYRVSDRIPLSVLVAWRTFGRDGYMQDGVLRRAYSTYIEAGYDFALPCDWLLAARVGITPARSLYTGYEGGFAVTLVGLRLQKTWTAGKGSVCAFAHAMLNPYGVNAANVLRPIAEAGEQHLHLAVGTAVSL